MEIEKEKLRDFWHEATATLKGTLSEVTINTWLTRLEPLRITDTEAYFYIQAEYHKELVVSKYEQYIKDALFNVTGRDYLIKIFCEQDTDIERRVNEDKPDVFFDIKPDESNGEYEYTFESFIVGSGNKFANAASYAVATNPASEYNPLFIYGGSGLGKTHLLYAIRHETLKRNPGMKILYIKGDDFTNQIIEAIRTSSTSAFRAKYRNLDMLLVDDIQFIGGKTSTEEEFFHTFNSLYEAKKQIVLTSDRPPKEMQTLEERLRTRFEWGLMADIQPPDFETRVAIMKRKAELLNIKIPDDVIEFIANRLKNNIRQLEGAVKKIKATSQLTGEPINIAVAQSAIKDILSENQPIPITAERITLEVSKAFNVPVADIMSNKRTSGVSNARQVSMYILRAMTSMSLPAIGEEFGGKDHSTVLHSIRKVESDINKNPKIKNTVTEIINNLSKS